MKISAIPPIDFITPIYPKEVSGTQCEHLKERSHDPTLEKAEPCILERKKKPNHNSTKNSKLIKRHNSEKEKSISVVIYKPLLTLFHDSSPKT